MMGCPTQTATSHFPSWLHRSLPKGAHLQKTADVLADLRLNTVCEEARCPNRADCYDKGTATFLTLGASCTRACSFCSIDFAAAPLPPEADAPERIAQAVQRMQLRHAVLTMVARDDLEDGGAGALLAILQAIRTLCPQTTVELLISDLGGNLTALDQLIAEQPTVLNHNVETVERLTPRVRHRATYRRSLHLLRHARTQLKGRLKSGLMVGLGETAEEIQATLYALAEAGVEIVTIGQYLQSDPRKRRVARFVTPDEYRQMEEWGRAAGIPHMYCAPFVRSSYNAEMFVEGAQHVE